MTKHVLSPCFILCILINEPQSDSDDIDFNNCLFQSMSVLPFIGVRDVFRSGDSFSPSIFSIACPKINWFCPNITCVFARK